MFLDDLLFYAIHNNDVVIDSLAKTKEGLPLVNRHRAPSAKYPLIEYQQIGGGDVTFADEDIYVERLTYQVTYYGEPENIKEVIEALEDVFRSLRFRITFTTSHKNQYTHIPHYMFHIQTLIEQDGYEYLYEREYEKFKTGRFFDYEPALPDGVYYDEDEDSDYMIIDGRFYTVDGEPIDGY